MSRDSWSALPAESCRASAACMSSAGVAQGQSCQCGSSEAGSRCTSPARGGLSSSGTGTTCEAAGSRAWAGWQHDTGLGHGGQLPSSAQLAAALHTRAEVYRCFATRTSSVSSCPLMLPLAPLAKGLSEKGAPSLLDLVSDLPLPLPALLAPALQRPNRSRNTSWTHALWQGGRPGSGFCWQAEHRARCCPSALGGAGAPAPLGRGHSSHVFFLCKGPLAERPWPEGAATQLQLPTLPGRPRPTPAVLHGRAIAAHRLRSQQLLHGTSHGERRRPG